MAEIILCRAKRLVELGQNVVVLADSLNSLVRAYNQTSPQNGKSTGGLENSALQSTKKFFGSARNLEEGGSLTIIATAYTDTDGVIYEEFKETCNMQLCINEEFEGQLLSNIDFTRSQTIKDGKILSEDEFNCSSSIRKSFNSKDAKDAFIKDFKEASSNSEFVFDFLSKNK